MTAELAIAIGGILFGAGGSWAVQVFRTSSVSDSVKELKEAVGELPTRRELEEMKQQIGALQRHMGDIREDVAELRGAASRR